MARQIKVSSHPSLIHVTDPRAGTNGNNYNQCSRSKVQSRHQKGPKHSTIQQWMLLNSPPSNSHIHSDNIPRPHPSQSSLPVGKGGGGICFCSMCVVGFHLPRALFFHFFIVFGMAIYLSFFCVWTCAFGLGKSVGKRVG